MAAEIINQRAELIHSDRDFDWLGPGAYFWESDPVRAREWAEWKVGRGDYKEAAVVGAVIDLRNCLDLQNAEDRELMRAAHGSFAIVQKKSGLPMPVNKSAPGQPNADRILRYLDCAVFRHLHSIIDEQPDGPYRVEPFDTVRGMFTEGDALYEGCGFTARSHVQLAVRNNACILGLFYPPAT
ncbi:hypothetical protein [Sphingomonas crocodyli]|uniref:hypothetical protein n=1 Tax=Sphingomonas crocodyli TaxID=1979270 RepID=UPI0019D2A458|nr:hypothetical protein [Sphingomonas crocodyli]